MGHAILAHSEHSGLLPEPSRRFSVSMLLPVLQAVLLWCTDCLIECQALVTIDLEFPSASSVASPRFTCASIGACLRVARTVVALHAFFAAAKWSLLRGTPET